MRSLLIIALLLAPPAWAQDNGGATPGRQQLRTPQGRQQATPPQTGSGAGSQYWRGALSDDAIADEQCEVIAISNAHDGYVDGRYRASATVRCADGRTLTGVRPDEGLPFHFSACDPTQPDAC